MSTEAEHSDSEEVEPYGHDSESEYVLDPTTNPWRRDPAMNDCSKASREEWGDHYNVHAQFLPWAHPGLNGFEALRKLTSFFESRPDTSKQVSTSRITSHLDVDHHTGDTYCIEDAALLSGWWCGGSSPASGSYYCNPAYRHGHDDHETAPSEIGDPIGDPWKDSSRFVRRLSLLDRSASMGLSSDVLVQPFGVTHRDSVRAWAQRHYFAYGKRKSEGRVRMARTWKTIHAWGDGDYSYPDIAAAFGVPRNTIASAIHRHAADFKPPRDPNYRKVEVR